VGNQKPNNRLTLRIEGEHRSRFGVSVALESGLSVIMRETEYSCSRNGNRLTLEIPASAMAFIAK